jgi:hypothetical protein
VNGDEQTLCVIILKLIRHCKFERLIGKTTELPLIFHGKVDCSGTPMFPVEDFRAKRSSGNAEKIFANFLSKNFDSIT